jgi:hypothetical protein
MPSRMRVSFSTTRPRMRKKEGKKKERTKMSANTCPTKV